LGNKVSYFDVSSLDERRLLATVEAGPLPDLLRLVFSEEEVEIYQMHRGGMSLADIGVALEQDRFKIHRKLVEIKSNIRFLLRVKRAVKVLPRLVGFLCPPQCPFRDKSEGGEFR
jgi:hypothetical protein